MPSIEDEEEAWVMAVIGDADSFDMKQLAVDFAKGICSWSRDIQAASADSDE